MGGPVGQSEIMANRIDQIAPSPSCKVPTGIITMEGILTYNVLIAFGETGSKVSVSVSAEKSKMLFIPHDRTTQK
jgi:hypothetical protein